MKLKKSVGLLLSMVMMVSAVGCSSSSEDKLKNNNNNSNSKEDVVVATSVAVAEILDKLGVKLSGVPTTSYELPESAKDAVEVGNPMNPDLEIIKSLNPTKVVSVDTLGQDFIDMFTENNIPSEFIDLTSLDGLKESVKNLGEIFKKQENSQKILDELKSKEDELKLKSEGKDKPKVMIIFGAPGSVMLGTSKSYVGNLVELAGGENVLKSDKSIFLPVNKEELLNLNPDKIVVMTHANPEETKKMVEDTLSSDPAWKNLSAVKEGKVEYLENDYFGMSANLKVIEALDMMHDILYK